MLFEWPKEIIFFPLHKQELQSHIFLNPTESLRNSLLQGWVGGGVCVCVWGGGLKGPFSAQQRNVLFSADD